MMFRFSKNGRTFYTTPRSEREAMGGVEWAFGGENRTGWVSLTNKNHDNYIKKSTKESPS
jgi:hypothetical protein